MSKFKLYKLFGIAITMLCLIAIPLQSPAVNKGNAKITQPTKERLVLMPLRVGEDIQNMLGAMETALAQGLQQQYTVFAGEDVAKKTREIFKKESAKKNCDETRCMEDIAIAFQSELIATANVAKIEGGYLLALSIRNVMDNKAVYNNSLPCKGCDAFQVVEKLKDLGFMSLQAAYTPVEPMLNRNPNKAEIELWQEVMLGHEAGLVDVYLSKYPNGIFSPAAKDMQANEKKLLNQPQRPLISRSHSLTEKTMEFEDLAIDLETLDGDKVKVRAFGMNDSIPGILQFKKRFNSSDLIFVDVSKIPREQRKQVMQKCEIKLPDYGCAITVIGTVGDILGHPKGVVAEQIIFN